MSEQKLHINVLLATAIVAELNIGLYIATADHYDDKSIPDQPDGYVFMNTGSSTSATVEPILFFPAMEAEAPAHEVKPRPALISKA